MRTATRGGIGLATIAALVGSNVPVLSQGPGLGNLSYEASELFQPVSVIHSPRGHGNAALVNGYLMLIDSSDSGGSPTNGGIEFWDVSDPRDPTLAIRYDDPDTHELREAHGFSFRHDDTGDHVVVQTIDGIQFWDVTDPLAIEHLATLDLPGISGGDYDGIWWVFWQAPYVYAAGVGEGLYVVDASDASAPFLVERVLTSEIGGMSPSQVFAVGNLLVLATADGADYATMDVSDPLTPTLLHVFSGASGYSHLFAAGRILTSGAQGEMVVHAVGHDGAIAPVGSVGSGLGKGGYGSYQDGFFHSGFSDRYAKFEIESLTQIGSGTSGIDGRDEDFGFVMGNLVWVGEDHAVGSALIVHDTAPDEVGPQVHWIHPADGAGGQALTSRIGLSMSDNVDIDSVDETTFLVRPPGGSALPGQYSVQMGLVNFCPETPLEPGAQYEVIVHGIRDLVGNPGPAFASTFTTTGETAEGPSCVLGGLAPAEVGSLVTFDVVVASGSAPLLFSWDFGDGTPSTPPSTVSSASHAYDEPGRYPVIVTVTNEAGLSTCSGVQIVHHPLTSSAPVSSGPIVYSASRIYNVNPDQNTVTAIDEASLSKLWETPAGERPRTLAISPAGDLWIACEDDATIRVVRASDGAPIATHALPRASRPYGLAVSPDGAFVCVTLQATGRLLQLDLSGNLLGSLDLGPNPRGIAITGDSERILVTRFVSPATHAEVWDVDASTLSKTRTIELAFDPGPDTESSGRGVPNYLTSIHVSPDGRRALVPSKKDNVARGVFRDGQPLTFESRTRTIVSCVDLIANEELLERRIDLNDRAMAQSLVFSPPGDLFFVALQGSNRIEIFDANSGASLGSLPTGRAPQGTALAPASGRLFVHDFLSRSVSVFDAQVLLAGIGNAAERVAEVSTVSTEALSPNVLLGKRLFYDASDPRMSRDGYVSCAGCHLDGGSDGRVWDFTQNGEGLRNTIPLTGRGGLGHGNLHWTANFDEIQDFENDIREGFAGVGFLSDSEFAQTADPLGDPKAGLSVELDALAAYVSSLDRFSPSPHRNPDGTMTGEAIAGRAVFENRNCQSCHAGRNFTDGLRHDVGTIHESSGEGIGEPLKGVGFETPTLIGLWASAPYLHNGQAASLEKVLENPRHGGTDTLTPLERSRLVAYLLQIEDEDTPVAATPLVAARTRTALSTSPNPFASTATVRFHAPSSGVVRVTVHDVRGRLVKRLVDGFAREGEHEVFWEGTNHAGAPVASGVYFLRLEHGERRASRRVLLLR